MSLKNKVLFGFKWSFIDSFAKYFLSFFIGIILARLLSPDDYGIIGMTTIFIAVARVLIDGGFSDALIRKLEPSNEEYSTVFIFNIILAVILYTILYFSAPLISAFFNEVRLKLIIRIVGISLIISSTSSIQIVILRKNLNFKLQAIISFTSTIISGIVSVNMAFAGYGVWSLVSSVIVSGISTSTLLWILNKWRPKMVFSLKAIKEHLTFGSKIMVGSFINVIYDNMFYVLIGKLFTPVKLGFFTKADSFQKLPASTIDIIVRQVTYPVLASIQYEENRLKNTYKMMIRVTSLIVFILLFGLAAVAKPFIIALIGIKWLNSVPYLQLLCFVGIFYPLISINSNILNVKGRSDLSLLIMLLKVILSIPALILGYSYGITFMITGMIGASICLFFFIIFLTNNLIEYTVKEQLTDIGKSFLFAIAVVFPVYLLGNILNFKAYLVLLILLVTGFILFILIGQLSKNNEYIIIKELFLSKLQLRVNLNK